MTLNDFILLDPPYSSFLTLVKLSSCHVYLTYPFVLSWSLLEAMSISCPVVASSTAPVRELISHDFNGLLVDFFSKYELADAVSNVLTDPKLASLLGRNARTTILNGYSLENCVPKQLALMELVASSKLCK